jgi:ribosomal protein L40E
MPLKICEKCGEKSGPRARKCKKCDGTFAFKVKSKDKNKQTVVSNWRDLVSGDYIKTSGGPVWINKDGTESPMGYSGIFSVVSLDENGILACGRDKTSGFCHIWMTDEVINSSGIHKRPHKVSKINVHH